VVAAGALQGAVGGLGHHAGEPGQAGLAAGDREPLVGQRPAHRGQHVGHGVGLRIGDPVRAGGGDGGHLGPLDGVHQVAGVGHRAAVGAVAHQREPTPAHGPEPGGLALGLVRPVEPRRAQDHRVQPVSAGRPADQLLGLVLGGAVAQVRREGRRLGEAVLGPGVGPEGRVRRDVHEAAGAVAAGPVEDQGGAPDVDVEELPGAGGGVDHRRRVHHGGPRRAPVEEAVEGGGVPDVAHHRLHGGAGQGGEGGLVGALHQGPDQAPGRGRGGEEVAAQPAGGAGHDQRLRRGRVGGGGCRRHVVGLSSWPGGGRRCGRRWP
jgi:hypothetical protein